MFQMENRNELKVSKILADFLENDVLSELNLDKQKFWNDFQELINNFSPRN